MIRNTHSPLMSGFVLLKKPKGRRLKFPLLVFHIFTSLLLFVIYFSIYIYSIYSLLSLQIQYRKNIEFLATSVTDKIEIS